MRCIQVINDLFKTNVPLQEDVRGKKYDPIKIGDIVYFVVPDLFAENLIKANAKVFKYGKLPAGTVVPGMSEDMSKVFEGPKKSKSEKLGEILANDPPRPRKRAG
jgi:exosome complex RNA-binding protein Rrp4